MSFFSVLDASKAADRTDFEVKKLHLNLWSLAALGIHRRMFVLDVGLLIEAKTKNVGQITLALPFDTLAPSSLHSKVLDRKLAGLIFDREVSFDGDKVTYGSTTFSALEAMTQMATKVDAFTQRGFSLWDIPLTKEIQKGDSAYIRVRFPISGIGRTWQWTKSRLVRNGAIFDFRISDIRSSQKVAGGSQLIDRIRPIRSVAAFVMAPIWLHAATLHPEPAYIRLLEGNVWSDYLERSPELSRRSRLVVYYWREEPDPGKPITTQNPMRAFAQFRVTARSSAIRTALIASPVLAFVVWGLFGVPVRAEIVQWWNETWAAITGFIAPNGVAIISVAVGIAVIAAILRLVGWSKSIGRWVKTRFHDFEQWLFHFLRDVGPRD